MDRHIKENRRKCNTGGLPMISAKEFRNLTLREQREATQLDYVDWKIWTNKFLTRVEEDLSNKQIKTKLKELEKKLKAFDYLFFYSDDSRSYKRGKQQEDEIKKLIDEIGPEGKKRYLKFLKDKGLREAKKDRKPTEYEVHLQAKMKQWDLKSLDDLEAEVLERFWAEVDSTFKGKTDVKFHETNKRSLFPEMDSVVRKGLGYGDGDRPTGQKSLTAGSFCDAGNLYPEDKYPKFIAPSKERMRYMK